MCTQVTCTVQPTGCISGVSGLGHPLYRCEAFRLLRRTPSRPHDEVWGQQLHLPIRMLHLWITIACLHSQLAPMCGISQQDNCNAAEQQGFCLDTMLPVPALLFTEHPIKPSGLKVTTANCKVTPLTEVFDCTCRLLHLDHRHKDSAQLCLAPFPPLWANQMSTC